MSLEPEVAVSIVALAISLVALSATVLQVLQQYFASATGYARCNEKAMGEWGQSTKRIIKPSELRFEVQFEAPVIFLAPPNNVNGPVPNEKIYYLDGSRESYKETRTLLPDEDKERQKMLSRKQLIHTADNERASWVELLAAAQKMEADSSEWQKQFYLHNAGNKPLARFDERTLAIAVQRKVKSWDTMPSTVIKPYATSAMCHIIELAGVLGLHWKEFSRSKDKYRAEGNGYMLTGSPVSDLGLVFTFQRTGRTVFKESRVIPKDEVKGLCFGVIPTIFCEPADEECLKFPLDDVDDTQGLISLHLGSPREIGETLMAMGCNTNTVNYFLDGDTKMTHLFPVPFEIMGMLGRTIHASGSAFRMLPNPTIYHWDKKSFSMWALLEAYEAKLNETDDIPDNDQQKTIEAGLERIFKARKSNKSGNEFTIPVMEALHGALDDTDRYLLNNKTIAESVLMAVLRGHFQEVLSHINQSRGETTFEALNKDSPEHKQVLFMDIYFDKIRPKVMTSVPKRRSTSYVKDITAELPTVESNDHLRPAIARPQNSFEADERLNTIWCTLVYRMLCWLLLHDFHKQDKQIPKSELLGSRLPVYIM